MTADETATAARAAPRRSFVRRPAFVVVAGIVLGFAIIILGASLSATLLLVLGGAMIAGGPIAALLWALHRHLGLTRLPWRPATLWGVLSGAVAIGVAIGLELLTRDALHAPHEWQMIAAGPIEEVGKLLLPLILLALGVAHLRDPRLGVWVVAVSGGVFGIAESAEYVAQVGPLAGAAEHSIAELFPQLGAAGQAIAVTVGTGIARTWVELMHVILTAGAAAIIWPAVHRRTSGRALLIVAAIMVAAAIHSFNDGILPLLPGFAAQIGSIVLIVLAYVLWYRPFARRLVPPYRVMETTPRWLPRLPRTHRSAADTRESVRHAD